MSGGGGGGGGRIGMFARDRGDSAGASTGAGDDEGPDVALLNGGVAGSKKRFCLLLGFGNLFVRLEAIKEGG